MNKSPVIFTIRPIYKRSRWLYNTGNRIHIVDYRNTTVCGLKLEVDKDNRKSSTKEINIVCKRCNHRKYDYIKRVQFVYPDKV